MKGKKAKENKDVNRCVEKSADKGKGSVGLNCVVVRYLKYDRRKRLPDRPATYLIDLGKYIEKEGLKQSITFAGIKTTERAYIYKENHRMADLLNENITWVPLKVNYFFLNDADDKNLISYLA